MEKRLTDSDVNILVPKIFNNERELGPVILFVSIFRVFYEEQQKYRIFSYVIITKLISTLKKIGITFVKI